MADFLAREGPIPRLTALCCRAIIHFFDRRLGETRAAAIRRMQARTLYDKFWDAHVVRAEADGTSLIYIDRHLVHEVTSPQAYEGLRLAGRKPWRVASIVATADHNTPTQHWDAGHPRSHFAHAGRDARRQHQARTARRRIFRFAIGARASST